MLYSLNKGVKQDISFYLLDVAETGRKKMLQTQYCAVNSSATARKQSFW